MILRALDGTPSSNLKRWSKKKILCKCDAKGCEREWQTNYFHVAESTKHYCFNCKVSFGKKGCVHSKEHRANLSKSVKLSEKFKNALSKIDRKKHSELMKQRWRNGMYLPLNEEQRKRISDAMKGNRNSRGESGGFCKWYDISNNGKTERVQGTWELLYANYLIQQGVFFKCHPNFVEYKDELGKTRRYFPDFYLLDTKTYVDVKNPFCIKQDKEKIERVRSTGINLTIISKTELQQLGLF